MDFLLNSITGLIDWLIDWLNSKVDGLYSFYRFSIEGLRVLIGFSIFRSSKCEACRILPAAKLRATVKNGLKCDCFINRTPFCLHWLVISVAVFINLLPLSPRNVCDTRTTVLCDRDSVVLVRTFQPEHSLLVEVDNFSPFLALVLYCHFTI